MGQSASIESAAPASQQMSNVLPAGVTSNVRVQCVEASNATLEKLQAVMRDGCDAAALSALSSKTFDTTSDATVAQVQNFLAPPPTDADAADAKPLYLFAIRKVTEVAAATTEEEANGLVGLPPSMTVQDVISCPEMVTLWDDESIPVVILIYSSDERFGNDMMGMCCIVALIAAVCACCVGLCCCGAAAMKGDSKKTNSNANNNGTNYNQNYNNNNNNNTNNGNYMANPNYGSQPVNNYGLPPNQGQTQYGNQSGYNYQNNGYQQPQQQPTGTQANPLQPAPL